MKNPMKSLSLFISLSFLLSSVVHAADNRVEFHPDYPGSSSDGSHLDVGQLNVKLGVFYFRKVFERWPASWSEVQNSGIFPASIPGFDMIPLEPDNEQLTDYGDVYYEPPSSSEGNPVFHCVVNINGMSIRHTVANGYSVTYAEQFRDYDRDLDNAGAEGFRFSDYLADTPLLKQFAILGIMEANINQFRDVKGRLPVDMQEFMISGFSPITQDSINPVTGQPFRFDGSAGDAFYEILQHGNFRLRHVGTETETRAFTY